DLQKVAIDRIAYIQFDDAPHPESEDLMGETMNRRVLPGEGTFELDRFAATLLGRGFDGVVSVEVLSQELLALPVREVAQLSFRAAARYWG
ncbi:MAG: sugar phosphate isomerase/epimerase, partial [Acidimicrobiia bacterium]|nr:sugar phosphate isomerase/epimerase [Acidimicrobiia bacterium]